MNNPRTIQENIDAVQAWLDALRCEQNHIRAAMRRETNGGPFCKFAAALIPGSVLIAQAERWLVEWRIHATRTADL